MYWEKLSSLSTSLLVFRAHVWKKNWKKENKMNKGNRSAFFSGSWTFSPTFLLSLFFCFNFLLVATINARIKLLCRFIEISARQKFLVNNLNDRNSAMNELLKSCKVYTQIAIQHLLNKKMNRKKRKRIIFSHVSVCKIHTFVLSSSKRRFTFFVVRLHRPLKCLLQWNYQLCCNRSNDYYPRVMFFFLFSSLLFLRRFICALTDKGKNKHCTCHSL